MAPLRYRYVAATVQYRHIAATLPVEQAAVAGGSPTLTLTLAKRSPDNQLWGYLMLADRESQAEDPGARPPPDRFDVRPSETKAW